jgi:uncharacterized protein (TIGR03435 family)
MRLIWALLLSWGALAAEFEVASVRPSDPRQSAVDFVISPGGRLRATNVTLLEMVREAYRVKYFQVSGGPGWIGTDRFHIEAKAAGEPTRDQMLDMLRALLEERFRLKVRREVREGNVYELVVARSGPKLKASTAETSFLRLYRNTPRELPGVSYTIHGQKVSMAKLANDLTGTMARPVLDRTGLAGEFDFKIDYAIEGHAEVGPSMFTALQEQLGLRLQAARGAVESLEIESAQKPAGN